MQQATDLRTELSLSFDNLLDYTDWERQKWHDWLRAHADALRVAMGLHGDGRMNSVGEVVRHIFSAEKRYIDRIAGRPITDTSAIPTDDVEQLFDFGQRSRAELKDFISRLAAAQWDAMLEFPLMDSVIKATTKKVMTHIVLHEIRHWAQIKTVLRLNGLATGFHDLILSPVMGGGVEKQQKSA